MQTATDPWALFYSLWKVVTCGVQQGSVLGPVLFLVYLNDLPRGLVLFSSMFVDDTKLVVEISDVKDCKALQRDLGVIAT